MEYKSIKPSELRVGDIITVQFNSLSEALPHRLFSEVVVTDVRENSVHSQYLTFWTKHNTFYLIERPKKPLPKSIGSVVEVDGVKYVRVLKDSEWHYEWVKVENTDHFETISTELLSVLNYSVV